MKLGYIGANDWKAITMSLDWCTEDKSQHLNFVEVGVATGRTSWEACHHILSRNVEFTYFGVDPNPKGLISIPWPQFNLIKERSVDAIKMLPMCHWMFIDGCHCENCVRDDMVAYDSKLVDGGYMLFHDTLPTAQGGKAQKYTSFAQHDMIVARRGVAVISALASLDMPSRGYELLYESPPGVDDDRGTRVYRKGKSSTRA